MTPRDPAEPHRAATPLELFFDLCFVVAIAAAASKLHHGLAHGQVWESVGAYGLVFFAIWWAWMNLTWFASAYDCGDGFYTVNVFLQMAGVLVIAAGVPPAFEHREFGTVTLGYTIIRVAMIAQWLRAAAADPARRTTAFRYAFGLLVCQTAWIVLFFTATPREWVIGWCFLVPAELLVPVWAERALPTPWNAHHIAERYGLLTLIVLGESVLASTVAIQAALETEHLTGEIARAIAAGMLILFSMWSLYFRHPAASMLTSMQVAFEWGYAHLFVFASAAAVGAGLALYADFAAGHAHIDRTAAAAPALIAAAVFVILLWRLYLPVRGDALTTFASWVGAALVVSAMWSPWPMLSGGIVLAVLATVTGAARPGSHVPSHADPAAT